MKELYPEITDPVVHDIDSGEIHKVYVEECGNPEGIPIIFIHGGPGSGCQPYHRQFFDPEKYRIILFDQRGAGRSTPKGSLEENTTQDLIADMEAIREKLKIDRWVLFGGSWGVTLALLYAETYPGNVSGLILRGSFLATKRDLNWFFGDGVGRIFPDEYSKFISQLEKESSGIDTVIDFHKMINSSSDMKKINAAKAWLRWTGIVVTWTLEQREEKEDDPKSDEKDPQELIKGVQLELHYAVNEYFLKPDQLMKNIDQIPDIPVTIIHGRRDITCPMESSWQLHNAIPKSKLVILHESGHLASEPAMIDALVSATDNLTIR
ncbi:MAG: prolyl aminopeptidase [Gammaproteobacteria bacterium]